MQQEPLRGGCQLWFLTETAFAVKRRVAFSRRGDVNKAHRLFIGAPTRSGNSGNSHSYTGAGPRKCSFSHGKCYFFRNRAKAIDQFHRNFDHFGFCFIGIGDKTAIHDIG